MRRLCYSSLLFLFISIPSFLFGASQQSAIVYYGDDISYPMVGAHEYIIVQPDNVSSYSHGFKRYQEKIYAYISVGEMHPEHSAYVKIDQEWQQGSNEAWQSKVMDVSNPKYHRFLLENIIDPVAKRGYRNFFFDTLDSYQLVSDTDEERQRYKEGLITFIGLFKAHYPDAKLIVNRGFELIDEIHSMIDGVLFESYFNGLSGTKLAYAKVSAEDREWLDIQINKITAYNLPVIALDYMDPKDQSNRESVIKRLQDRGLIPYISDRDLLTYGSTSKSVFKRDVLMLYDSQLSDKDEHASHLYGSLPLEYMGYVPILHDVKDGLPAVDLAVSRYAGVIIWLTGNHPNPQQLMKWIELLHNRGIKTLFMSNFGVPLRSDYLSKLGIHVVKNSATIGEKSKMLHRDAMIGFEMDVPIGYHELLLQPKGDVPLFTYRNAKKQDATLAALMPWGGYAFSETAMIELSKENIWIANPFSLFKAALRLETIPVPDPTTENAKRLLFTHVDGDGIMNRVEFNPKLFSGNVVMDQVLKHYQIPHSISIIEAETASYGLYPDIYEELEALAQRIMKLDNVEGASHTFTHPYKWKKIVNGTLDKAYRLGVKNYDFSIPRDITGSIDYVNTKLMPEDKTLAQTIFWSGDCSPQEEVLEYMYRNGYLNINGGDTIISNTQPWLSNVAPLGIKHGEYYQIYTGQQNENVYTNDWTGPFWGFKKVIQTFKMTEKPRRLKPINIYYHFYAGSKRASLSALKSAFDWATTQDVMPIYTSEYIKKVMDFYDISIVKEDGKWLYWGMKHLKTLRLDSVNVDMKHSRGVVGYKAPYISLAPDMKHVLVVGESDARAYLIDANAGVSKFYQEKAYTEIAFKGHVDIALQYHLPKACQIRSSVEPTQHDIEGMRHSMSFENTKEVVLDVYCQ